MKWQISSKAGKFPPSNSLKIARALTPYPGDLNHAEVVHLPLKMD
jgi:hypothetical protein